MKKSGLRSNITLVLQKSPEKNVPILKELSNLRDMVSDCHSEIFIFHEKQSAQKKLLSILKKLDLIEPMVKEKNEGLLFLWVKASAFDNLDETEKALLCFKEALKLCQSSDTVKYSEEVLILHSISSDEYSLGRSAEARKYANLVLQRVKEFQKWIDDGNEVANSIPEKYVTLTPWKSVEAIERTTIANLELKDGNLKKAAEDFRYAAEALRDARVLDGCVANFEAYADCLLILNRKAEAVKAIESAEDVLLKPGSISIAVGLPGERRQEAANVLQLYDSLRDWCERNKVPALAKKYDLAAEEFAQYYHLESLRKPH